MTEKEMEYVCDNLCKYPSEVGKDTDDWDLAQDRLLRICDECPFGGKREVNDN